MNWTIRYAGAAERDIDALGAGVRQRVLAAIGSLARDPYAAPNAKALTGRAHYRLRVGDWRVIYTLQDNVLDKTTCW